MTNNFELIKPLLEFRSEDDFYFLQIIQRKKDHKQGKVKGTNNNSRLVKPYFVNNLQYLEFITPEVIELCKVFNARAGINLNRRSYKKMAFHTLKNVTDLLMNNEFDKVRKAYSSVCGKYSQETDKKWILDIDYIPEEGTVDSIMTLLYDVQPIGHKFIASIPSKNGVHIISSPFNIKEAEDIIKAFKLDIHKNNPTNLYIP